MMGRLTNKPVWWSDLFDAIAHTADLGITRVELEEHDIPPKILSRLRGNLRSDDGTDAEIPEETLRTPQRSLVLFRTGAQLVLTTHDTPPFWTPLTQLPEVSEAWLCEKRRRHPGGRQSRVRCLAG